MPAFRNFLRAVFRHDAMNREMNDELRAHLAKATERLMARGMSRADAELQARREFGNVGVLGEQGRDARGASWVETLRGDLRFALRSLRASPSFTLVAVLSLAIGIGANTAIFSLINAVMLRSLPVHNPGQLAQVTLRDSIAANPDGLGLPYWPNPLWESIRDATTAEADYAVSAPVRINLASAGEVRPVVGMWVNGDYFNTLGVRPVAGRLIARSDDYRGCPATVVLSEGFWQAELGGSAEAIGKPFLVSGKLFTVLGVVPREFFGVDVGSSTPLYMPLCAEPVMEGADGSALANQTNWWLRVIARPKAGISLTQYRAKLRQISHAVMVANTPARFDAANRAEFATRKVSAFPAAHGISEIRGQYSKALLVLMGMVGVILLISCANVANLMLARGAARGREMAIRVAIGASRGRLVRQSLTEALLLAAAGTLLGLVIAMWASQLLVAMLGSGNDRVMLDLAMDARVLSFAILVCLATVILFGLAPAWRSTNVDPQSTMKAGGRGNIEGHSRFRIGKALVVAQSALALILVVGAGLLVTTFRHLTTAKTGFDPDGVLVARFSYQAPVAPSVRAAAIDRIVTQVAKQPGVAGIAGTDLTPISGAAWNDVIFIDGQQPPADFEQRVSWFNKVDSGYFGIMRTRMLAGRDFGAQDTPAGSKVAIVNQAMAKHFFKDESPLGKRFHIEDMGKRGDEFTIIGVVENARYLSLRETDERIAYVTYLQDPAEARARQVVIRTASISATIAAVKDLARSADPRISIRFSSLADQISQSLRRERVLAVVSAVFGSMALLLAMIGLYGVMAYTVARRRTEIGIRIALGAARGRVIRMVLSDVGRLTVAGIVLGTAVTMVTVKVLASLLYGVEAKDPRTLIAAIVLLAASALVAAAIPARRAASLQPIEALRED